LEQQVGGKTLDDFLVVADQFSRIVACGAISQVSPKLNQYRESRPFDAVFFPNSIPCPTIKSMA
jgi:NADPH-dependent curcumin reductase CurA